MITTYTFTTNKNSNFRNNNNFSKTLDDIISASLIKKNSYLIDDDYKYPDTIGCTCKFCGAALKDDDEFIKAANFLSNYKKNYFKLPKKFIFGKIYKLNGGTPIIFYDNEIQIGSDLYSYSDFSNMSFLNNISDNAKKTIINIYTNGIGDIKINIF